MNRIEELKKLLEENPCDTFLQYALAIEENKTGNTEQAIKLLNQLISNYPNYLPSYYQLASWLFELKSYNEAMDIAKQGLTVAASAQNHKTLRELKELINQIEFEQDE